MVSQIRWKFVAAVAIVAMAVSLTSGGLGGVRFGSLVFRALLGGLVFAALAVGLNLLIAQVFPELLEEDTLDSSDSAGNTTEVEQPAGSHVDIVMPEEAPPRSASGTWSEDSDLEDRGRDAAVGADRAVRDDEVAIDMEPVGDLDRFSEVFTEVEGEESSRGGSRSEGPGSDQDPAELAQAISTVLKRDEEG